MPRHHMINNEKVWFTAEEEDDWDAEEAFWASGAVDRQWVEVRTTRNRLLAESDWRGVADLTMSDAWKTYRQALRDVGGQADPANITWPAHPNG